MVCLPTVIVKHETGLSSMIEVRGHRVTVDVPPKLGGNDAGPTAVELFVGALAACANFFIAQWCERAGIPHAGIETEATFDYDEKGERVAAIWLNIHLPPDFPQERRAGALKVAQSCILHNTLKQVPPMTVELAQ